MTTPAIFIDPLVTVADAASLLSLHRIEGLLVADEDGWYGIITTADIREKILFAHKDATSRTVREIMTACPATAQPSWPLGSCLSLMNRLGARCLPVEDQEGYIIGVVSPRESSDAIKYPPHN
jgi:CBS domain-containing protein